MTCQYSTVLDRARGLPLEGDMGGVGGHLAGHWQFDDGVRGFVIVRRE